MVAPATVLVVEDDPILGDLLRELLAARGHRVEVATSGPEGVACFGALAPALVLIDVGLPRLSGDDVLRAIRAAPGGARTPVVLMSAAFVDDDVGPSAGPARDPDARVRKPFDLAVLVGVVERLLREGRSPTLA
ncbi:MAG: response regulator [Kofleriaceae bacterium]